MAKIQHKRSSTAAKIPLATDLSAGELAINTADGKIFAKKDDGTIVTFVNTINLNSYAPTLTGGGASGNWSINSASATKLAGAPAYTNGTDGWFRSNGAAGWYNADYAVGLYATEAGAIRTYNGARIISSQGTASLPAYAFANDLDTGLYSESDGSLNFSVNGQYVGRFDAGKNFGVVNGIYAGGFYGSGTGLSGYAPQLKAGDTNSVVGATWQGLTWIGIQQWKANKGSNSYGANLDSFHQFFSDDSGCAGFSFHRAGAYATNVTLDPDNCIAFGGWSAGATRKFTFNMSNSDFTAQGNVIAYSDGRLKTDWQDVPSDFIERWATVKHGFYRRIDENLERQHLGLIAQDVLPILPPAVIKQSDGYYGLNYGASAAVATVELAKRLVEQANEIKELKQQMARVLALLEKV